jgi:hypothetical protein
MLILRADTGSTPVSSIFTNSSPPGKQPGISRVRRQSALLFSGLIFNSLISDLARPWAIAAAVAGSVGSECCLNLRFINKCFKSLSILLSEVGSLNGQFGQPYTKNRKGRGLA